MSKRGLVLLDVLLATAILVGALSIAHFAFFGGGRAYIRARARLDTIASCRAALARAQADVRRAAGRVEVSDDGAVLKLTVLDSSGPGGLPTAGADGRFKETPLTYSFDAAARRLLRREGTGADEVVGRDLPDVVFSQRVLDIGAVKCPVVTLRVTAVLDGRPFGIEASAVPRLIAGWAANPAWVFTTTGSPYEFKVDQ